MQDIETAKFNKEFFTVSTKKFIVTKITKKYLLIYSQRKNTLSSIEKATWFKETLIKRDGLSNMQKN